MKCPNCNGTNFVKSPKNYALNSWERVGGEVTMNLGDFMPVKIENCTSCGFLKLMFDTSESRNVNS